MEINDLPLLSAINFWQILLIVGGLFIFYRLIRLYGKKPQLDADWEGDCALIPEVEISDSEVRFSNFRDFIWKTTRDKKEIWTERTVKIDDLENIWYIVDHFSSIKGLAHIMLSFEFKDGQYLTASFECRRRKGQRYNPWNGLWRHYELYLLWGSERDLIGLRTNARGNEVHLYRVISTAEKKKELFLQLCHRSQQLATRAEWYNSVFTTCLTSIVQQVNRIAPNRIPFTWRYLLPGHSTRAALRLGLIEDWGGYRSTVQQGYLEAFEGESVEDEILFNRKIREKMPELL